MTWQPDLAVCISLPRRQDRRAARPDLANRLGFPIRYFNAVDGAALPADAVPSTWGASPQAYANMVSHRQALMMISAVTGPGLGTVLVLEDDAVVPLNFQQRLEALLRDIPPFWESIYLGGEHARTPVAMSPLSVRPVLPIRTLGYIVRYGAVEEAVEATHAASSHWDLTLGRRLVGRNTCFAPSTWLVTPDPTAGSDIPDSEPYRAQ